MKASASRIVTEVTRALLRLQRILNQHGLDMTQVDLEMHAPTQWSLKWGDMWYSTVKADPTEWCLTAWASKPNVKSLAARLVSAAWDPRRSTPEEEQ